MIYFLKKSYPSKKGLYLQIYSNFYDPSTKKKNTKSYKSLGYVSDLIKKGIANPVAYYTEEVKQMNKELNETRGLQITSASSSKYAGHFLLKAMFDKLDMDKTLNIIASSFACHYQFSEMFKTLCYSQILSPGSKLKAIERIIPNIYNAEDYSYDQVLDAIKFIGGDYHKYIEMLNHHISSNWSRNFKNVYFDCTNYYFEIDLENDFLKNGPGKENRKVPLMGQALLLDGDQIPLDTEFYPGNESEKPYLRKRIEDMKVRNNISGRVIQVADKGLNCARNIYSAVVEANDGYIFSKSIKGNNLSQIEKEWVLLIDNDINKWTEVRDKEGNLLYKYKVAKGQTKSGKIVDYDIFTYKCKINPDDKKEIEFSVKEKRIITYNPALAIKQRAEIQKEVDKLTNYISYRQAIKEEIGDSAKYLNYEAIDNNGKKVKIATSINMKKVYEDLDYCGYNMLVTSEINANPEDIYKTYHNLWRIEESFRIMKTYLEARPAFVSTEESIKGHFLICYFSLTILRLLELKTFEDKLPASQIIEFIRQYKVTKNYDDSYINNSIYSKVYETIKVRLGLSKLGNLYLSKKDLDLLFETELD